MNDVRQQERASIEKIDGELADRWERMIEEADQEIHEVRVSFRWTSPQVAIIKRAAAQSGISYQAYIKQAAFRRALADLGASAAIGDAAHSRQ